ncbi:hypothetical protein H2204_013678 [Knufia peltigerae]|uniref:SnoaL-like domain-containing protein n=1 Tax=Knufia peltigerae TaxID=1002370 RepID=A0AA38XQ43_9EURO|nr:hypothetical protein H2204_013678 [Knufia peltigerae]
MATNQTINLAEACLCVFSNRNETDRIKITHEIFSPDVTLYESDRVTKGYEGLEGRMKELIAGNDFEFKAASEPVENHGLVIIDWTFGPTGGDPVLKGTDITLNETGKIDKVWVNFSG